MTEQPVDHGRGAGDVKLKHKLTNTSDIQPLEAGYRLSPEQAAFFKSETGIDNDKDLKTHILDVADRAYKVFPYPCIQVFSFLTLGMTTLPTYERIIQLGKERPNGILLDMGSCFGVDARKAAADGFPLKNIVTTDLKKEFDDLGHELFKTTPASYPISFVAGDVFDPNMLQTMPPFEQLPQRSPDLSTLTSLNPLLGHCSVIYASNFFHLFSEENQFKLAKAVAGLLSPEPGSMICGEHGANWQKGILQAEHAGRLLEMFCHSPESWTELWDGEVFAKGKVKVETHMEEVERAGGLKYSRLQWSVVRL